MKLLPILKNDALSLSFEVFPPKTDTAFESVKSAVESASPSAELYAGGAVTNSDGGYNVAACSTVTGKDGTVGRIFVMPSSQMATTAALITNGYANKDFIYSVFEHLYDCRGEFLPYGTSIISFRTTTLEGLTMGTAKIYMAVLMALPVCVGVVGAVILTRRKNR